MYFYSHDTLAGPAYLSACVLSNRINHQFANETAQKRYFYACVIASNQENIIITKRSHLDFSTGMMIRRKRRWLWNPKSQFKAKKLLHPLSNHELNRSAEIQIQGKFEEKKVGSWSYRWRRGDPIAKPDNSKSRYAKRPIQIEKWTIDFDFISLFFFAFCFNPSFYLFLFYY